MICTKCKIIEHEGLTCNENLIASMPPDSLRNKVIEDFLTLKCPRCSKAFLDFDGCFALKCSACPCAFCGWCLQDCGTDAHPHVIKCSSKPKENKSYFGSFEQFEVAQHKRQQKLLSTFLDSLDPVKKRKLLLSMAVELKDYELNL